MAGGRILSSGTCVHQIPAIIMAPAVVLGIYCWGNGKVFKGFCDAGESRNWCWCAGSDHGGMVDVAMFLRLSLSNAFKVT
jgi:hypothetical protein